MNPYEKPLTPYEQRLRDEVIYLHSLWHRGPPALNPNPNRLRPKPFHNSNNNPSRNLHVSYPTSFKKTKGNKHGYQNAKNSTPSGSGSSRQPDPGPEWPINPPRPSSPPNSSSGWPSFKVKPSPSAQFTPGIHEAKIATMQMQQKIVKCCNEFFGKKADLDSEEDNKFEEEDEGDDSFGDDNDVEETDEYKFFFGLFVEHRELRDFYEKNQETGDFYCLVCGGMGVKVGKMFKGCLGLVQHAIAILRTKRKRAHRALGQVICRVLGWDFGRLPVVVLKDEPLSQSLASLGDTLVHNQCTTEVEFVTMPVNIEPLYLRTKAILLDSAVPTLNESGDEAESKKEFRGEETSRYLICHSFSRCFGFHFQKLQRRKQTSVSKPKSNFLAMNPYEKPLTPYEQRLRDEVIYLHSLWHRGPPALNPSPNRLRPKPFHNSNNKPSRNLHVSYTTSFKKTKGNKHGYQNAKNSTPSGSGSSRQPDPGPEWPSNPPPPSSPPNSSSGWPSFKVKPSPSAQFTPGIHEAKIATMQMQQKIVRCCNEFFGKKADLDSEEDNKFEEEDEGDDSFGDDNDVEETDEYKFFFGLFVEHRELRDFYEKNQETGDFYCLVCGGMGVKVGKMFKGCLGLVQHAIAILRTKRKRAHRALGQVICRVLGWDFGRLPVVVLKDEPLSQSLASLGDTLSCLKEDANKKVVEDLDNGVSDMEGGKEGVMDYETSLNEVDIGTEAYNILGENSGVDDVQGGLSR
ncbi:uncharacterized protein LOC110670343 [Hevea brasiliensis]|uniref:uncharacterized protein LOC110670343 n=1 Tax=Hevea brasiliensis TaxID=3981 RepID=UPI0025E752D1|nr:uncharacterized protein LOC110670343 [Hevea brasiliensis]